jgi:glycosyltransferase involved in cell wall biosynthesis
MRVVITVPAYNEEKTIGRVISGIKEVMDSTKYSYQVMIVNDGSSDRTAEIAKSNGAMVYSHPMNYGLAETFKTEMQKCLGLKADVIVHTDADGQYLAKDIPKLLGEIEKGYDLVLGSRFKGEIEGMPFLKRWGNKAFSRVVSRVTRMRVSDSQTGFRAFTKDVAERINIISNFTYTQEQIIKAAREKFRIKEIPIYFAKRLGGESKLMKNPFDFAIKAWINLLRIYRDYEPLKFFGIVGSIFFTVGFLIGVWLVYVFVSTGRVSHIPSAILSMLFIMIGIQIVFFGFLADMRRS